MNGIGRWEDRGDCIPCEGPPDPPPAGVPTSPSAHEFAALIAALKQAAAPCDDAALPDRDDARGSGAAGQTAPNMLLEMGRALLAAAAAMQAAQAEAPAGRTTASASGEADDVSALTLPRLADRLLELLGANDRDGVKALLHAVFRHAERGEGGSPVTIDHGGPIERTAARLATAVTARDPLAAPAIAALLAEVAAERAARHQRSAEAAGEGVLPVGPAAERKRARESAAAYARVAIAAALAAKPRADETGATPGSGVTALLARLDADTARGLTAALGTDLALASIGRPADHPARREALDRLALVLGAALAADGEGPRGVLQAIADLAPRRGGVETLCAVAETLVARAPSLGMPLAEALYGLFDDVTRFGTHARADDKALLADLVLRLAADGIEGGRARNPHGLVRLFREASDWRWRHFLPFLLACEEAMAAASPALRRRLGESLLAAVAATAAPADVLPQETDKFTYESVGGQLAALVPAEVVLADPAAPRVVAFALARFHAIRRDPFAPFDGAALRRDTERLAAILADPEGARLLLPAEGGVREAAARRALLARVLDDPAITVDTISRLRDPPRQNGGKRATKPERALAEQKRGGSSAARAPASSPPRVSPRSAPTGRGGPHVAE